MIVPRITNLGNTLCPNRNIVMSKKLDLTHPFLNAHPTHADRRSICLQTMPSSSNYQPPHLGSKPIICTIWTQTEISADGSVSIGKTPKCILLFGSHSYTYTHTRKKFLYFPIASHNQGTNPIQHFFNCDFECRQNRSLPQLRRNLPIFRS